MSVSVSSSGYPVLDKYELLEEIGHGGMATVYRGRDVRLDREVAIKVIHKHLRDNPEVRRRFVSEAKAVAKLRHPGIVDVYDVSDDDAVERYLVVELVRGTTLRQLLQEHVTLPAEIGAGIVLRLCEAVEHAHQSGVIHRDIKPENVLIALGSQSGTPANGSAAGDDAQAAAAGHGNGNGGARPSKPSKPSKPSNGTRTSDAPRGSGEVTGPRVKLTDFGIAKVIDTKGLTSTGQILGSPAHMAPEQIEGGEVGPYTDVFALGVLLYEMVVGHLPFEGKNPAQVLRRVLDGIYESADSEQPQVGGRWAAIIGRALERDPAARTQSAAEIGASIRQELGELGRGDVDAELAAFFLDPDAYRESLCEALVPRLLERGEEARRKGRIHQAADDFNRALAFQPTNLGILRRVSALGAQGVWKRRTARFSAIVLGSLLLGSGAYGVTRWLKPQRGGPAGALLPPSSGTPDAPSAAASSAVLHPRGDASAGASAAIDVTQVRALGKRPPSLPPTGLRKVQFSLIPKGALLTIDGQSEGDMFGRTLDLTPGPHAVHVTLPPGSRCCKPRDTSVTVTAPLPDKADEVQRFTVMLEPLPSTVTLSGGPPGGQYACPSIRLAGTSGGMSTVTLPEPSWAGTCEFSPGGKRATVLLQAGEANSIPWPSN